jgi:hypothetical protein
VLFIVSGATYWVMKDGSRYATGYWAEEFANPYKILTTPATKSSWRRRMA